MEKTHEEIAAELDEATDRLRVPFGTLFTVWMLNEIDRGTEPAAIITAFTGCAAAAVSTIIEKLLKPEGHGAGVKLAATIFSDDIVSMTAAAREGAGEPTDA